MQVRIRNFLRFGYLINFELICVCVIHIQSFVDGYPLVPASFAENTVLSLLNGPSALVRTQLNIDVCTYSWTLFHHTDFV